jgi:CheY-like chemotaxis protein
VLYIEDNLANLLLVQRVLAHRDDVEIISAMQGRLGLDLARQHQPVLILLDLHLPDVPGDQLLQQLREDPETAAIPVVIISADATTGQIRRLLAAGARDYLTKPFDVHELLRMVDEAVTKQRSTT